MANRSYLYSSSEQNINITETKATITDLSEWNYDIPLSYFILVSGNTALCQSLLTNKLQLDDKNEYYSLSGDFDIGYERLIKLLSILNNLFEAKGTSIEKDVEATKQFLANHRNDFIYLETIELDIMDFDTSDELKTQCLEYAAFAQKLGQLIDSLPEDHDKAIEILTTTKFGVLGREITLLENICIDTNFDCSDKNFMIGITEWSNNLNFSLNSTSKK